VAANQSAFIKGRSIFESRSILESSVVAHEIVHSINSRGEKGVILKLRLRKGSG
jgi:Zn-dependent membrane protease YugP